MIKILFCAKDHRELDVEKELNLDEEVSSWLEMQIEGLHFDCMDYPFDLGDQYVCYFQTYDDYKGCQQIFYLLKDRLSQNSQMTIQISIVDSCLENTEMILDSIGNK